METIVAMDLGKFKSVVCYLNRSSLTTQYRTVRTCPEVFHDLFAQLDAGQAIVLFEVSSQAGWIADMLSLMGLPFKVANTNHPAWRWTNNPNKSDKTDAHRLAMMYHHGFFPETHIPCKEVRQRRSLIYARQKIVNRLTQIKNSIRALLCTVGIHLPAGRHCWTKKHLQELAKHAAPLEQIEGPCELWRGQLHAELQMHAAMEEQLDHVTSKLDELGKQQENVKLLQTVPGVGPRTAEAIVAVIDTPQRFKSCRQVCNYIGFTPRRYQSGDTDRSGRISKRGNPLLRMLLVQAGWVALKYAWAREIYQRVCRGSSKRRKTAIIAVARHLLMRCWAMLRDHKPWQYKVQKAAAVIN
jgi:transposase